MRNLSEIAREIIADWKNVNVHAEPYLRAMLTLNTIEDRFMVEDGKTQVIYFLCNANTWRGETARRIKKELNAMIK